MKIYMKINNFLPIIFFHFYTLGYAASILPTLTGVDTDDDFDFLTGRTALRSVRTVAKMVKIFL